MKILLVEDDLLLRQLYTDLLTTEKYEVTVAEDGDMAYEKMKQGGWDLVLLDMNLPGMSGLEVLKKLKAENIINVSKKVIFMSASGTPKDVDEMKNMSDGYFIKSDLNPDEFVAKVREFI